jgi:glycosyltransferase 2 family protein
MKLALRILLAVAGLALFGWFVHQAGVGEISAAFANLGWWLPLALVPFVVVTVFDTIGWRFAFGREGTHGIRFPRLLQIRWAGEAINSMFPSAYIGGEAVKVHLLRKRGVPPITGASSVVAGKTAQVFAQVTFIGMGAIAGITILPSDSPARSGMFIVTGVAAAIVGTLFWLQKRGIFTTLLSVTQKLRIRMRALTERAEKLRALDHRIFDFYRKEHGAFVLSFAAYLAGWMSDTLEILLVSHLLGMPVDWTHAIAVEAFISVAKAMGLLIPGALGVQESGFVFLFLLFGLPTALGVSYAIFRRGRELIFASIGATMLYAEGLLFSGKTAPKVELAT